MLTLMNRDHLMSRFGGGARGAFSSVSRALTAEHKSVRTGEVALSSFAFGFIQGRYGQKAAPFGVPLELWSGVSLHLVALLPFHGITKYSHHLHALGDGALATFFAATGSRVGSRVAAGGGFLKSFSGEFVGGEDKPISGGASLTDAEMTRLIRGGK